MERMMAKMTAKAYAIKHRISLFEAIKRARKGEVQSITVTEDGKEKLYIIDSDEDSQTDAKKSVAAKRPLSVSEEIAQLRREIEALKARVEILEKRQ